MANTISLTAALAIIGSGISAGLSKTVSITQTGSDFTEQSQSVGAGGWEQLDIAGDIGTLGPLMIINQDAANFVQVAYANDGSLIFAKLLAGEPLIIRPTSATIYVKADTAPCIISVLAIEL